MASIASLGRKRSSVVEDSTSSLAVVESTGFQKTFMLCVPRIGADDCWVGDVLVDGLIGAGSECVGDWVVLGVFGSVIVGGDAEGLLVAEPVQRMLVDKIHRCTNVAEFGGVADDETGQSEVKCRESSWAVVEESCN